jgi:hypothetical protein
MRGRESSVGITTRLQDGQPGFDSQQGQDMVFSIVSRPALGPPQSIKWVPGMKRDGREADHSPPSSAEVKNGGAITSTPPYAFMT